MIEGGVMVGGVSFRNLDYPNVGEKLSGAKKYRGDKNRAYQEGYSEFIERAIPVTVNKMAYRAHENINLYLDTTGACNCSCRFCIAKTKFNRGDCPEDDYIRAFENAVLLTRHMDPSVQIVGGEPTLNKSKLGKILEVIERYQIRRPVLGTNGAGLQSCAELIRGSTLEHVNISRHHYNDNDNQNIMRGGCKSGVLSEFFAKLPSKIKPRLQCNMLGGEIDTYGEVMQFIAYGYHKLGITTFSFAELTPLPKDSFYRADIIDYTEKHTVDTNSILERFERDGRFKFLKYRGGVACYYEIWEFMAYENPVIVQMKFSDNRWLEKADDDPELLPDLVLHTDGTLCGSWNRGKKILHEAE